MYKLNLTKGMDYHTQINNEKIPFASCNTTSFVMALKGARIPYPWPDGLQEEDFLTDWMHRKEAWSFLNTLYPNAAASGMIPQNYSDCLAWGINELFGRTVDHFTREGTLQQMIWEVSRGHPIVMSGPFTESGHFICLVGFETLQNKEDLQTMMSVAVDAVQTVIIDDPYGDYHTSYRSHKGNDIMFGLEEYNQLTNRPRDGCKWLHIIKDEEYERKSKRIPR